MEFIKNYYLDILAGLSVILSIYSVVSSYIANKKINKIGSEYKEKIKLPNLHKKLTQNHSKLSDILSTSNFDHLAFNNITNECIAILDQAKEFLDENISLKKVDLKLIQSSNEGWEVYRCLGYIIRILDGNIQDFVFIKDK